MEAESVLNGAGSGFDESVGPCATGGEEEPDAGGVPCQVPEARNQIAPRATRAQPAATPIRMPLRRRSAAFSASRRWLELRERGIGGWGIGC